MRNWEVSHALWVLAALLLCVWQASLVPLQIIALSSLLRFVAANRGNWTPRGGFGLANSLTLGRALILSVSPFATNLSCFQNTNIPLVVLLTTVYLLDGLDGRVARARGTQSEFGAVFDREIDSWLVLILCLELYGCNSLGLWILLPGLLHYVYVVVLEVHAPKRTDEPRSFFGRIAFSLVVISGLLRLAAPHSELTWLLCAMTTAAVTWSFLRSFRYAYTA